MHRLIISLILVFVTAVICQAQMWQQNDQIFNPSGIPSLPFSQPRFADLDNDQDMDMILGNISGPPLYFENTGSQTSPHFQVGESLFASVQELDCEIGVCAALDADGEVRIDENHLAAADGMQPDDGMVLQGEFRFQFAQSAVPIFVVGQQGAERLEIVHRLQAREEVLQVITEIIVSCRH